MVAKSISASGSGDHPNQAWIIWVLEIIGPWHSQNTADVLGAWNPPPALK